jgi:hypothetical protein
VAIGKIKELKLKINTIDKLFSDLKRLKNDIYEHLGEDAFSNITQQFEKLNKELKSVKERTPIGHLYDGVYYLKQSEFNIKNTGEAFLKKEGRAFMREDLDSWRIENQYGYFRQLYKTPNITQPIKREDGAVVFDIPKNF